MRLRVTPGQFGGGATSGFCAVAAGKGCGPRPFMGGLRLLPNGFIGKRVALARLLSRPWE
ncbi:MAG: hypothetical protein HPY74_17325 [Firmicutes bacterium]|nr:hypothetical protein [Bacillota bacterium]